MRRHFFFGLVFILVGVIAALSLGGCAAKGPATANAFSYGNTAGGDTGAFVTITNPNGQPDKLLAATSTVSGRVELHTVVKNAQGAMVMQQVPNIEVPASGTLELKPGSYHIMLFGLNKGLKTGDSFPLTLKFEKGGETTIQVQVKDKN